MAQPTSLSTTVANSAALIDQYLASLEASNTLLQAQSQPQSTSVNHPSPLYLLAAAAQSLKSTVTKLSLLAITTPFTASALSSTLQPLNTSVLPSLVTAALLSSPTIYPEAFARESSDLTRATLRDFQVLLRLLKKRSEDGQPKTEVSDVDKKQFTESTGRVWEDCDILVKFSNEGVVGFVCKKAGQWLELMRDAVKEFEEWDPEDDVGDDPFGLNDTQSDNEQDDAGGGDGHTDRVAMSAGVKDQALKVLSRIPQSVHVVVKQRLAKIPKEVTSDSSSPMVPMPTSRRKAINKILKKTRKISECIDESAEGMYMGDPELCLKKAGEARALTIEVVEVVLKPWEVSDKETKEDQYIKRALSWIQQVEPGGQQPAVNGTEKGKEKS